MQDSAPHPGPTLRAIDGSHIGRVIESRHGHYRVEIECRQIWLSDTAVWDTDERGVTLICDFRGVSRYEVDAPPL